MVFAVLASLLCAACLVVKPPVVVLPTSYTLAVSVYADDPISDRKLPGVSVSLATGANPAGPSLTTDGAGNATFTLPPGDYDVWAEPDGYLRTQQHIELRGNTAIQLVLQQKPPPVVVLPRLVVSGQFFALENGQRFTAIEASDFNLLNRWQHGEDITPILVQRAEAGFNLLRVWTLYDIPGIGTFLDIDYGRIPEFLQACAQHGLYVEFTAYTSIERPDHWDRLIAALRGQSALVELGNELNLPVNKIDLSRYARPTGVLASHGSGGSEADPILPVWDYATVHYNDAPEWWRKTAHNPMSDVADVYHVPALSNENTRYCDRDASLAHAYDAAAGAALLTAGSCFHSVSGKASVLWTGCELDAARAWAGGVHSVALTCQPGAYTHRTDRETPDLLRVYQRGSVGCIVPIRK
jgi:hypothetical protein